ncbi:MAG: hypothetical protein JW709_12745 [Sedimentisphaerales bacterium]|nr:hypothetical protein [Sedimentisphaerales bacterium]
MKTSPQHCELTPNVLAEKYPRIRFACTCGLRFNVPRDWAGGVARCKQCGKTLRVPSRDEFHKSPKDK